MKQLRISAVLIKNFFDAAMAVRRQHRPLRRCTGWALIMIAAFTSSLLSGCLTLTAESTSDPGAVRAAGDRVTGLVDRVIAGSKEHLGKAYKFRNEYGRVMDCGGFISYVWSLHGVTLPPSSRHIAQQVERLPLEEAERGDLLFFKGRRTFLPWVGHVSMVIGRQGDRMQMIHSCSRGVVIDDYPTAYYSKRFLFAGRIPGLPRDAGTSPTDSALPEQDLIAGPQPAAPTKESLSIIGVGDIMLGTNYPDAGYLPPNDGRNLLTPVADILRDADLTFGNLEGAILTGKGTSKTISDPGEAYAFKSPDHYVRYLVDAGSFPCSLQRDLCTHPQ